ncbi:methyltransferase family protein [Orrella marina]|uniref:Isoprenylcysteine carboxylmethyltransferase family protein n=1 Tax=Orrella marina TaxID=2163011 RepID=A0A2R4XGP8_9BURK|nr:isoprenylcysteine carboxylmethyltransferase family protein [Orrella marina]AWB32889.1 isoprenylcysteine carboxylmethyltransferase family protein [Orrella marina]
MGYLLVIMQFGILVLLAVWAVRQDFASLTQATPIVLLAGAVVMGVWAVTVNRPGNFNITPDPKPGSELVTAGPYRWIRHPMYTSVLLFALACVTVIGHPLAWIAWVILLAVLWGKARMEEQYLLDTHEAYQIYMVGKRRFIPWIL